MKGRELLLAVFVPLSWGLGFTLAKAGLAEFPPLLLMSIRFFIAALVLVWFVPIPRNCMKDLFWIALVGSTIQYGLTFTGLSMIDASLAIIVIHLEVPFGVLLAVLVFRERPGLMRIFGMVVSFLGILLISGLPGTQGQLFAIFLTGSGAMIWAVGQIMYKRISAQLDGLTGIAWIGVMAAPQMLVGSFLFEDGQWDALTHATWIGWGSVAYLGLVMTVAGYGVWFTVLRRNPVSHVMPVLLLLPVFTIVFSVIILGERPSAGVLLGGVIVLVGVAMIVFAKPVLPAASKT
ncbi:MAG TPA: EamA family transporter [Gammaproteobacteria bacterium]|jgi:O-acetylserine/cysteine efflux transporter|nr:EamA family transporter [Acidiferrobacteraceae bacterium]MDP6398698.1 EamA family transporter [Arenicellales bacterium]HCX86574.1 EamA family transporter [Gammaproteobacteria bacterium]MDP6551274.1 EamA family transporter [Arenicellales bacterium]MDP6791410.1 EamA family transporter [Arenicellales bacterium]|tara:strand:+ start:613 stop:1485 length:873 start_codon:yes stop_codon:yes gene_type:complete